MRLQPRHWVVSFGIAACTTVQAAGSVDVSFVNPAHFADAGSTASDQQAKLRTISEHLQSLGERYLKAGQVLKIDVLDVYLAGYTHPSRRRIGEGVRVARGGADWPKISVRYTLQADGQVIRSGEETIADLSYLQPRANYQDAEPLGREKQMLDRWFKDRFVEQRD